MHDTVFRNDSIRRQAAPPRFARGLRTALAFLLLFAPALSALAQSESVLHDRQYLRYYPTPEKVRADVVATAGDARPEVVDGRIAGRLYGLASILKETWGGDFGKPGDRGKSSFGNSAPAEVKRLHDLYLQEYLAIQRDKMPPPQAECSGHSLEEQKGMGTCARTNFGGAEAKARNHPEEIAGLYFPEPYRSNVVAYFAEQSLAYDARRTTERQKQEQSAAREKADRNATLGFALFMLGLAAIAGLGSLAMIVSGTRRFRKDMETARKLDKYELQNKTDGGVVQFRDYESAVEHRRTKGANTISYNFSFLLIALGIFGLLFAGFLGMIGLGGVIM